MSKFEDKYKVIGEWVHRADYYELEDHSSYMTDNSLYEMNDSGYESHYYAIVEVDEDGWYADTVEDDFNTAEEAWKRYDELKKEAITCDNCGAVLLHTLPDYHCPYCKKKIGELEKNGSKS